jgi:signal transduction histidine kinase/ActR/RegA family two-component response regulator
MPVRFMRMFRDLSIRTKLVLLAMASAGVALLLSCIGLAVNDIQMMRDSTVKSLSTQARMLAFNSTAVLSFRDAPAAEQLLKSLKSQPLIEFACLYDSGGKVLATFAVDAVSESIPPLPRDNGHEFTNRETLEMFWKVQDGDEFVGTLYLSENVMFLRQQLYDYVKIASFMMLCSLLASGLLAMNLQKAVSKPILALARTAVQITTAGDYSIRVRQHSRDELGTLYEAFNKMLEQVEASERQLLAAQNVLEVRVLERTAQLRCEITEKERAQAELERARDAAETATRTKSEFLANMSHEIRTPITAILGFVEVLLEEQKGDWGKDELTTIQRNGEHLLAIINDILDISKIEARRMTIERIPCSPVQVVADVNSLMHVRASAKGLALRVEFHSSIPETIQTDPTRIRQILINLIGNAIKFTEIGEIKLLVTYLPGDRPMMQFDVIDMGIGMTVQETKNLFQQFSQAETSTTRRFGGTGLGLAISKRLAEMLGGDVTLVQTQQGAGSHFRMIIATGSVEGVTMLEMPNLLTLQEGVKTGPVEQKVAPSVSLPGNILLAEDGPDNQRLIAHILKKSGADVTVVDNGKKAFDAALTAVKAGRPFDLILMDMQMPIMDGYEATTALRENGYTGWIVALTAHAMASDRQKCLNAGCNDYATKPIQRKEFFATLAKYIGEGAHAAQK